MRVRRRQIDGRVRAPFCASPTSSPGTARQVYLPAPIQAQVHSPAGRYRRHFRRATHLNKTSLSVSVSVAAVLTSTFSASPEQHRTTNLSIYLQCAHLHSRSRRLPLPPRLNVFAALRLRAKRARTNKLSDIWLAALFAQLAVVADLN